jgi:hypothetical protein
VKIHYTFSLTDTFQCAALELIPFLIPGKKKTMEAKLHLLDVREVLHGLLNFPLKEFNMF